MSEASKLLKMCELVHVPIPFLSPLEWAIAKAIASDKKLEKAIPLKSVKTSELQPTQYMLDRNNVNRLAREKQFDGALVFNRHGYHIYDGHHRWHANQKAGNESQKVRLVDLPEDKPASLSWFAKKLGVESRDIWQAMDSTDRAVYEKDL